MPGMLIIGATSGIAEAVARLYIKQQARFFLVARNTEKLTIIAKDLLARGASDVQIYTMDTNDFSRFSSMLTIAWEYLGNVDIVLLAQGTLPDQSRSETDVNYAVGEFRNNGESVIAGLIGLAARFESQGNGVIAVIGSVAGDRGRASNYLYGAGKAAIEVFASGLRARLLRRGVHVLLVKPGFVATSMTAELDFPGFLTSSPERIALAIQKAIRKRKNNLYAPTYWAIVMLIIRCLPEAIFKRLNF